MQDSLASGSADSAPFAGFRSSWPGGRESVQSTPLEDKAFSTFLDQPPTLEQARGEESRQEALQRERMWYVACTRARDLIPELPAAASQLWSRILDLGHHTLPKLSLDHLPEPAPIRPTVVVNGQTLERFVRASHQQRRVRWEPIALNIKLYGICWVAAPWSAHLLSSGPFQLTRRSALTNKDERRPECRVRFVIFPSIDH
jgi:hypothetical protein